MLILIIGIVFAIAGAFYCGLTIYHARSGVAGAKYVAFLAINYFIFSATFIALYLHPEKEKLCYGIIATNAVIWAILENKRKRSME